MKSGSQSWWFALLAMAIVGGCAPTMVQVPAPVAADYSYKATPQPASGENISIALIKPAWYGEVGEKHEASIKAFQEKNPGKPVEDPDSALMEAVARGLNEYLTASGFTVSGPYDSYDMMTFPEKNQADLLLTIEYAVETHFPEPQPIVGATGGSVAAAALAGGSSQTVKGFQSTGDCSINGDISFVLWEPLSHQRLWVKKIEAPEETVDCSVRYEAANAGDAWSAEVNNRLEELRSKAYRHFMDTAARYFVYDEMALVKKSADELKARKVY